MSRRATAAVLLLLAASAAGLYHLKHRVAVLEDEALALARALAREEQATRVLAAEWAYLNAPRRLARAVARHLELAPLGARAMVPLARLPKRLPADPEEEGGP